MSIPYGYCHCGCGHQTKCYESTWKARGETQGEPRRYVYGHQWRTYKAPIHSWYREDPETGCWVWRKTLTSDGYATVRVPKGETSTKAHRLYYEKLVGPIPDGLELDHLCRNRACVNPAHMEPVTTSENKRRAHRVRRAEGGFSGRVGSVRPYRGGWRVRIKIDGREYHVGMFRAEAEGREALDRFLRTRGLVD